MPRAAGVLLHPTSLPGRFPIGDFGPATDVFLDWLAAAGQSWWQILPLGPPAAGDSPYTCLSAFAGNPLLISPELLVDDGLLEAADLDGAPPASAMVDYSTARTWKHSLLRRAWERSRGKAGDELATFSAAPEQAFWLDDWALFSALRERAAGAGWWTWPAPLASRDSAALAEARRELAPEIAFHGFVQMVFHRQWSRVLDAVHARGLSILGDLPIYVAHDSAEVWARPELFDLDDGGMPLAVAGVPPDYFSETGQLWGNPLYRWEWMRDDGFAWWRERVAANLRLADRVRLDHFRAFASYWHVPAGEETAIHGHWEPGPGRALFDSLNDALGALPLVAEDLGDITPDVEALRDELALPGMRILQFGFGDGSAHAPHRHVAHGVVYTGTHDNQTTAGWLAGLDAETRERVRDYCGKSGGALDHWDLVRLAFTSVAELAVVPLQDVLGLGDGARMNTPSLREGNWRWRLGPGQPGAEDAARLRRLAAVSERLPAPDAEDGSGTVPLPDLGGHDPG